MDQPGRVGGRAVFVGGTPAPPLYRRLTRRAYSGKLSGMEAEIRCVTWRERVRLAGRFRSIAIYRQRRGFTGADRALSEDPQFCLLGEGAARMGSNYGDLKWRALARGLYEPLSRLEDDFMEAVRQDNPLAALRSIEDFEALVPALMATSESGRG